MKCWLLTPTQFNFILCWSWAKVGLLRGWPKDWALIHAPGRGVSRGFNSPRLHPCPNLPPEEWSLFIGNNKRKLIVASSRPHWMSYNYRGCSIYHILQQMLVQWSYNIIKLTTKVIYPSVVISLPLENNSSYGLWEKLEGGGSRSLLMTNMLPVLFKFVLWKSL